MCLPRPLLLHKFLGNKKIYLQTEKGSEGPGNKINIFDTKL